MKSISLHLIVFFMMFVFGCAGSSKTIKPSNETMPIRMEERMLSESPVALPEPPAIQSMPSPAATFFEPVPEIKPEIEPVPEIKREPISYSQITRLISELIDIKETNDIPGENRYLGISDNKLVVLEVAGDKEDILEASIKLIYPKDIDKITADLNNAMMTRFLKNAAPEFTEWPSRVNDIFARFNSMPLEGDRISREDIIVRNKLIEVLYDKNIGAVTLTLRRTSN